jgi:hypothetical protein
MREGGRRSKWVSRRLRSQRRGTNNKNAYLLGEKNILDMISVGAPLAAVLNNLCTAIDLQIGNIVSVMLLPNDTELISRLSRRELYSLDFIFIGPRTFPCGTETYWGLSRCTAAFRGHLRHLN